MQPILRVLVLFTFAACATTGSEHSRLVAEYEKERDEQKQATEELRAEVAGIKQALRALSDRLAELAVEQKKLAERRPEPPPRRPSGPDLETVYAYEVADSPVHGNPKAWVTIIEISDYQCPFCKRVQPTLKKVSDEYGDDVRIIFKHNPLSFHKRAMPAALAAECAREQGRFWPMHEALFENNRNLEDQDIRGYAKKLQLSMGKFRKCYDTRKYEQRILADQKTAVSFGARGTPAFFINGRFLSGAQPFGSFARLIDEELAKAKKSGVPRADYYRATVEAKGKKP
jgi:protein-disulfide isomerase